MKRLQIHCYRLLGFISLSLGVLGAFLPVLPTTCFVLLAAWAFSKSSPRFYQMLCSHKLFGSIIRDWQEHRAMSIKAKMMASLSIIVSFTLTLLFINVPVFVVILLLIIMLVLLASIGLINTKPSHSMSTQPISH